ncbi:MAG: TolC family protein [Ginsengibacter sp.]
MIKIFFATTIFILVNFIAFGQDSLSLQQAIELGIKNNLEVKQANLQMQKQGIALKQTKAFMLPDLNASASHGINQGRSIDPFTNGFINQNVNYASYGISSSVLLFQGSSLQNKIKENNLAYEAGKMEWQQAKDNLTINIILAYLQILSAEDLLAQSHTQMLVSDKQIERLKILNTEGTIAPSDLYDLKGQVANEQLSIADNEAAVANAKLTLCQLLNIPYSNNFEVGRLPEESVEMNSAENPENLYQNSLKNFAKIKAVHFRSLSAEKAVHSAKGELFPRLYLGGNLNTNYSSVATQSTFLNASEEPSSNYVNLNGQKLPVVIQQNNFNTSKINYGNQLSNNLFSSINLGLSIPLFNASQTRNKIKLAKIDLENNKMVEENTKIELQQSVERGFLDVNNALHKYKILQEQVAAFSESFRSADVRFASGVITSVDYLIAKNNLNRAEANLIITKYNFILRTKVLNYYQGNDIENKF